MKEKVKELRIIKGELMAITSKDKSHFKYLKFRKGAKYSHTFKSFVGQHHRQ